ncbi:MAG: hypothetical protein QW372_04425 [Nitrososphaerales archaeon]
MNKLEFAEDFAFILYLIPLILNGIYGILLWIQSGLSLTIVYLMVSKDPYIFLIGLLVVYIATIIEVNLNPIDKRSIKLEENARRMQFLAIICIILAFLSAYFAVGYSLSDTIELILKGRYPLIYPTLLILTSYLISPRLKWSKPNLNQITKICAITLILISPFILFLTWRSKMIWIIVYSLPLITLLIGIILLTYTMIKSRM